MIGRGSAAAPSFDTREIPLELAAAGYEANGADTDFNRAWNHRGQTYTSTEWLRDYRQAAENNFDSLCDIFQKLESLGPFDVRVFNGAPEYRPRNGVVCVYTGLTLRQARRTVYDVHQQRGQHRSAFRDYAGVYWPDTGRRVTIPG